MHTHPKRNNVIEASQVQVHLGGQHVLKGVDLNVPSGEVVALIGPNGSGKTTLLRSLLGLQKISSGQVKLLGATDVRSVLPRIGYVPQSLNFERSFVLSVREFLALRSRECRHWFWQGNARIDELLRGCLAEIGVESLLDRPVAQLSGGQLQRVLIAFSLLRNPELLLLD